MWSELLGRLDPDARERLIGVMHARSFSTDQTLFFEGQRGDVLYVIEGGHVLVERVTEQGDTVAVAVLGPDSIVGEQALVGDEERGATARALTATTTLTLSRAIFNELRGRYPAFNELLVEMLERRIRELNDLVLEARHHPAEDRVRQRVREMHRVFGDEIPLTQSTLAALAGTTRPTTNVVLQALQESGVVKLKRGRITVIDPVRLTGPG
jgi:CRP-like cAMP-binding protein